MLTPSRHDYKGRSVSPGSLSIWVHNLEGPLTYSPSVVAAGCSNAGVPAIKGSAGAGFKKVRPCHLMPADVRSGTSTPTRTA